jgi:hypothetical protein
VTYTAIQATTVFAKVRVNIALVPKLLVMMLGGIGHDGEQQPTELESCSRDPCDEGCQKVPIEGIETAVNTTASLE